VRGAFVGMLRQDLKRRFDLELLGEVKVFSVASKATGVFSELFFCVFVFMVSGNDDVR